ncbi:DUF1801 domain-containing protein [Roseateles sp. BYS78W]|uniref:DUF1801 domain-containing protein n=1 Tax=Pelomonas candidula TaxID=3299025 RepID=A0ABW7H614_9BURK
MTEQDNPSALIDAKIASLGDWRAELLTRLRALILSADDGVIETWKWDVPVWERDGILCTGETYKAKVKLTFPHGASLADPKGLFNSSLEGKVRRAIDFGPADAVDAKAFTALIREAARFNRAKAK